MNTTINLNNGVANFFNFKAIYNDGLGDSLFSILEAIEANKPSPHVSLWQSAQRNAYIAIFDGLPIITAAGKQTQIRFAVEIESHTDFKEITIHSSDFSNFCNGIIFNRPKTIWDNCGCTIDRNYYVPRHNDAWIYDEEDYIVKII